LKGQKRRKCHSRSPDTSSPRMQDHSAGYQGGRLAIFMVP
jgi:hypothetical protein